jgi:hypothetical protein
MSDMYNTDANALYGLHVKRLDETIRILHQLK